MPVTTRCPNCRLKYQVREESLGARATCKKCGQSFTVEMMADETVAPKSRPGASTPPERLDLSGDLNERQKAPPPPDQSPADARAVPQQIGPYTIRRPLGGGAMGEVWLAWDPALQRDVAIKTLRREIARTPQGLDRFLREARLAAKLHHTNAVTVYQVGVEGTTPYIAMEYVEGQSLDKVVSPGQPVEWREATRAIRDAAAGLAAAHELGLIHRDVKPANLIRTTGGVTKVVDFGLARAQAAQTQLTLQGSIVGTPAYMAPEVWRRNETDARADLYALACTYFCLLTGEPPFEADNPVALGYQHTHEPLPDPRQRVPDLPQAMCRILAKGASKEPEGRYQTAAEMLGDLEALLAAPQELLVFDVVRDAHRPSPSAARKTVAPLRKPRTAATRLATIARRASEGFRRNPPKWLLLTALPAAALLVLAIILSIQTSHSTVKIELSDPNAQVQVKVDGDVIDNADLKDPLRLKPGEHGLVVTSRDYESVNKSFTVRRGEEVVLRVTLEPKIEPLEKLPAADVAEQSPGPMSQSASRTEQTGPLEERPPASSAPRIHSSAPPRLPLEETTVDLGNGVTMQMVLIPAGEFLMGSPDSDANAKADQKPQHRVRITRPFYLGKYEVTQEQWQVVMGRNPSNSAAMKIPVIDASWNDYQDFVTKLNEKAGKTGGEFRLPTEAEWEYACRAGSTTKWYFGDAEPELGEYAWYQPNCGGTLHPVGQKRPNAWGLFDMMGNAWEWCADWYDAEYYARSSTDDPAGAEGGSQRVARGGCYNLDAGGCKASFRWSNAPAGRGLGFRLARILSLPSVATSEQTAAGSRQLLPFPVSNTNAAETQSSLKEIAVDVGNGVTMEMILIPAGQFLMGSPDSEVEAPAYEKPQHRVRITSPFYLGKYEVTEQQWEAVMPINVSRQKGPNNPVEMVSWNDCQDFLERLNQKTGKTGGEFRLPTEAEWEYACRAGSTTKWHFGDAESELGEYAWYSGLTTHPVGQKRPNAWGLHDMHGNVWEWCADWQDVRYYGRSPSEDPTGAAGGSMRVARGGGWTGGAEGRCRTAYRYGGVPSVRCPFMGFRLARKGPVP